MLWRVFINVEDVQYCGGIISNAEGCQDIQYCAGLLSVLLGETITTVRDPISNVRGTTYTVGVFSSKGDIISTVETMVMVFPYSTEYTPQYLWGLPKNYPCISPARGVLDVRR